MATTKLFPWGLHPLEDWVKIELENRSKEYDLNPLPLAGKPYSGPKTAWTRVFSNGISSMAPNLEGFVMGGTEGFDQSYGFGNDKSITIGVDAYGNPHKIGISYNRPDFQHRPPPSIVSVETEFAGGNNTGFAGTCRKTKITWKCYSLAQLEYLTPYFLTPRITILTEWGWNNYDQISLVDLSDIDWLYGIHEGRQEFTTDWVKRSGGNYDLAMGRISDYGYTMNEVGGYDCFTTIMNANYLIEGQAYQDKKTEGKDPTNVSGSIKLKDFTEFVYEDLNNITIRNKNSKDVSIPPNVTVGLGNLNVGAGKFIARDSSNDIKVSTAGRIFKTGDEGFFESSNSDSKVWLRMDLVADIINRFFQISFVNKDGVDTGITACTFDIKDIPICAHPALKSTNKEVLVPNQYAPRFVTYDSGSNQSEVLKKRLNNITQVGNAQAPTTNHPQGAYYSLFPNILKTMRENKFDDSFDDLYSIINPTGRSFPMFSAYVPENGPGGVDVGYWGYFEDLYVSVELFKRVVSKNETVLKMLEELLQSISNALCNIVQLKLIPEINGNGRYSIIDMNFSAVNTKKSAENLLRIIPSSINSAFLKSVEFDVKMSTEMSNQMIMQSSSGKSLQSIKGDVGAATYDPKRMSVSKFSIGDRLFDRGIYAKTTVSTASEKDPTGKAKYKRLFSDSGSNFYTFKKKITNGKYDIFILCENGGEFLKSILLDNGNKSALYTNGGIMPGTMFRMELLGIGGIGFLSQFTLDHVPSSYNYERCVWQVSDVKQKIENKMWTTSVSAQARPLSTL